MNWSALLVAGGQWKIGGPNGYEVVNITMGLLLFGFCGSVLYFVVAARRRGRDMYVRPIPGLQAVQEAIGRATEMGRPVLFVPGIQAMDNIQTLAGLVILGEIAKITSRYETRLLVPCIDPVVMTVAQEMVHAGAVSAGNPDAYRKDDIPYLAADQFPYAAGVNGIMLRDRPAAVIYMGAFYAESLMLAETGFAAGSIQIAGTAEFTQLPFFVAACDYTLLGEELYAASAYLSREPKMLGSIKAADLAKFMCVVIILLGVILTSLGRKFGGHSFRQLFQ